ncbi:Gamma-aminobutyric acid receptor alpha-like [Eumeta japonica]|uniref:Gamma-aminobutyric acid receptor alpha-like n=1 Tax=Eumeta variegata TaxID=151549 RepID=A0A4C1TSS3_EUMVA|nr:Gamma-aminobutyric acid receptor alpha-like [Eumeta japonica]
MARRGPGGGRRGRADRLSRVSGCTSARIPESISTADFALSERGFAYFRSLCWRGTRGDFSVLQVSFNLQRHTGYFLIQVYVPCILIVVLSWVSFWIHREATSDRVGLGITTVLTLSTISLDSRTDLPKVRYATALDWFLLMSFFYCIATLLEFAGVHYFTKVGSGEIVIDDSEWEELIEEVGGDAYAARQLAVRRHSSLRSANYGLSLPVPSSGANAEGAGGAAPEAASGAAHVRLTVERMTQTETRVPRWRQLMYCLAGDDRYRRQRQKEAGRVIYYRFWKWRRFAPVQYELRNRL